MLCAIIISINRYISHETKVNQTLPSHCIGYPSKSQIQSLGGKMKLHAESVSNIEDIVDII
jgi:hypothetical protein